MANSKWLAKLHKRKAPELYITWLSRLDEIDKVLKHLSNSGDLVTDLDLRVVRNKKNAYVRVHRKDGTHIDAKPRIATNTSIASEREKRSTLLSPTQKRLQMMRGLLAGETTQQAAVRTGAKLSSNVSTDMRKSLDAAVGEALHAYGWHPEGIVRRMSQTYDTAVTRQVTKEGNVVTLGPDNQTKYKLIELASKMGGYLKDRREITGAHGGAVVVRHTASLDSDD